MAVALWHLGRRNRALGWILPAAIVATAAVAVEILDRTPTYHPWLRPAIAVGAAVAAAGLLAATYLASAAGHDRRRRLGRSGLAARRPRAPMHCRPPPARPAGPIAVAGRPSGGNGFAGGGGRAAGGDHGRQHAALISLPRSPPGRRRVPGGRLQLQASAPIIIASGQPVITIGGFNGGDPAPTLAQFEQLVAQGKVRYVLSRGRRRLRGRRPAGGGNSAISQWATTHGTAVPASSYGNATGAGTLYQLS